MYSGGTGGSSATGETMLCPEVEGGQTTVTCIGTASQQGGNGPSAQHFDASTCVLCERLRRAGR